MISWPTAVPTLLDRELMLRPWMVADMDNVFQICQDPWIQEYTTVPVPYTQQNAQQFFMHQLEGFERQDSIAFAGVVNGEVVLSIALHHCAHFDHYCEVGYWVAPEARGNGFASRAAKLVADYAFALGFRRIEAKTLPENAGSQRTLINAGFEMETILRSAMTRRDQTQTDAVVFAKFPPVSVEE